VARQPIYPFVFSGAFSKEAAEGFSQAGANGIVPISRIMRSAAALWLAHHKWLLSQGYNALTATDHLLKQTEGQMPAPPQPQPSFAPQPAPSPFAQPPINGGQRANP
jgi:hypothetical protein